MASRSTYSWRLGIDRDQAGALVTGGILGRSRNPVYLGLALLTVGVFLVLGRLVLLAVALVFLVYFHFLIRREERFLAERYGEAYREYARSTAAVVDVANRGMTSEEDAMQFETIRVTCDGSLGCLTLTPPDRLKAMYATILQELAEAAHCDRTAKPLQAVFDSLNGFARVSSHG